MYSAWTLVSNLDSTGIISSLHSANITLSLLSSPTPPPSVPAAEINAFKVGQITLCLKWRERGTLQDGAEGLGGGVAVQTGQ